MPPLIPKIEAKTEPQTIKILESEANTAQKFKNKSSVERKESPAKI